MRVENIGECRRWIPAGTDITEPMRCRKIVTNFKLWILIVRLFNDCTQDIRAGDERVERTAECVCIEIASNAKRVSHVVERDARLQLLAHPERLLHRC